MKTKTLVACLLAMTAASHSIAQPVQWRVQDGGNGHWYDTLSWPVVTSWTQARDSASARGGHLVTIQSNAENNFVYSMISVRSVWTVGQIVGPWIGLSTSRSCTDCFEWVNAEPITFTKWWSPPDCACLHGVCFWEGSDKWQDMGPDYSGEFWSDGVHHAVIEWDADCNNDGIVDKGQILSGQLADANANGIPDVCECTAPGVITQPSSQAICSGASVSFAAAFSGTTSTFQWRKNGATIIGATGPTLVIASASVAEAGLYTCVATNPCGSVTTSPATLTVQAAPAIVSQPQAQLLVPGGTATFSVGVSGSTPTYQWRRNGSALTSNGRISGATSATLMISSVATGDQGVYDCVVTGDCGSATSVAAALDCKPVFTQQPQGGSFTGGSTISLTPSISTAGTTTYRWRKDGINIFNSQTFAGVTTPTLTIHANDPNDSGAYSLAATNACGVSVSQAAIVDVSCLSDFNRDGGVDGEDLFAFFNAWEQGLPEADLSQDGGVDIGDVMVFFERWESGC
jgi:Immunoglobulin domain/Immunoglobulin I-set domain/Lectin C-type domain